MFYGYRRMANALLDWIMKLRPAGQIDASRRSLFLPGPVQTALARAAAQAAVRGLAPIAGAELSVRLPRGYLAINRRGVALSAVQAEDWIVSPLGKPSPASARHLAWHQQLYAHTEAGAVLLAQPPFALLVARLGLPVEGAWLNKVASAPPLYDALPTHPGSTLASGSCLIEGAGLLAWGAEPEAVVEQAAQVELLCQLTFLAHYGPTGRN